MAVDTTVINAIAITDGVVCFISFIACLCVWCAMLVDKGFGWCPCFAYFCFLMMSIGFCFAILGTVDDALDAVEMSAFDFWQSGLFYLQIAMLIGYGVFVWATVKVCKRLRG